MFDEQTLRLNISLAYTLYGGGSVMLWACFIATEPRQLAIIDGAMNSTVNVKVSMCELKLNRKWIIQQESKPKQTSYTVKQ